MRYLRTSESRGKAQFGWLNSRHSFSFGHYYDPQHMGFSVLRVINDDVVQPGAGFDTHGHRDMEIISYVLEGAMEHQDSEGNRFVVPAGEVQRMTAGTGITHSEYNHSKSEALRFLQIWILPNEQGLAPGYDQKKIVQSENITPLVTPDGRHDSLRIHQDVSLYRIELKAGETLDLETLERPGYLHVMSGDALAGGQPLSGGDALGVYQEALELSAETDLQALWFDLPESTG